MQVVFRDKKRFCLDGPDNISSYVEHKSNNIISPHWLKRQMVDDLVMILGAISNFGNLVINIVEGKYNSLKYLDDL